MILTPAYGRDYKSKQAVLDAFNADKDFILNDISSPWDGKPINRPQIMQEWSGGLCHAPTYTKNMEVTFRYDKLRKSFIHKLT